ncbi:MAG: hypothetical protein INR64_12015, partial [Caulobacteraceae bacterium]|nr:hypothetical protein [Caulobacter sp.]
LTVLALVGGLAGTLWQARRAERRYREVRQLTNSYLFEVHDAIRDLPGSTAARRVLVGRALEYLDRLSREISDDRQLQLELAAAYVQIGDVQGKPYMPNLGESAHALASYARAVEIAAPLAAREHGAASAARRVLSQAEENIGAVRSRLNQCQEAARSHRRSLAIRQALLKEDPAHAADWSRGLAANHLGLGDALVSASRGQPAADARHAALEEYRRALPLCERLHAAHPDDLPGAILLVKACGRIASELGELGAQRHDVEAFEESAVFHRRALETCEAILRSDPTSTSCKRRLADELMAGAHGLAMSRSRLEDAAEYCQRALELTESLAGLDPANAEARQDLSSAHFVAGLVCQARGDAPAAAAHYRQSLAILEPLVAEHPDNAETAFDLDRVRRSLRDAAPAGEAAVRPGDRVACEP